MPLSIKNDETENLARKLAALTGESLTTTIRLALSERYERVRRSRGSGAALADELNAIGIRCSTRPVISTSTDEEILGYDEWGAPTR